MSQQIIHTNIMIKKRKFQGKKLEPPSKALSGPEFSKGLWYCVTLKFSFFQSQTFPNSKLHDTLFTRRMGQNNQRVVVKGILTNLNDHRQHKCNDVFYMIKLRFIWYYIFTNICQRQHVS